MLSKRSIPQFKQIAKAASALRCKNFQQFFYWVCTNFQSPHQTQKQRSRMKVFSSADEIEKNRRKTGEKECKEGFRKRLRGNLKKMVVFKRVIRALQQKLAMYYQINNHGYLKEYLNAEQMGIIQSIFPSGVYSQTSVRENAIKAYDSANPHHVMLLQQRCFQAADPNTHRFYNQLRQNLQPELQSPQFSTHYDNNCFVKMEGIFDWMEDEGDYPSLEKAGNDQIPKILKYFAREYSYVPNLERQLLYYPTYLAKLEKEREILFNGTNVDLQHAYFCSVIIALEASCPYIAARYANKFILKEGNINWLKSIQNQPPEIKPLRSIFRKIVRDPWDLCEDDFSFCKESGFWNTIKAINYSALAVYINSLCTLALAMGAVQEEPCPYLQLQKITKVKQAYDAVQYETDKKSKMALAEEIKKTFTQNQDLSRSQLEELQRKQILPYMKAIGPLYKKQEIYEQTAKICKDILYPHEQILKNPNEVPPLSCMHENDYAESVVRRLMDYRSDIVDNFYERSAYVKRMTFSNFGEQQRPDTEYFRRSVRVYTERMLAYMRNESRYTEKVQFLGKIQVRKNPQLTMPLKFFIRLLALAPVYIKKQVITQINHESGWIECFDLGHLAVLITETKARCNMTSVLFCILQA